MSQRNFPAGHGIEWLKQTFNLLKQNPLPFLLMGLILGVMAIIPVLGSLALLILAPTFYAGIAYAAREQDQGRPADFKQLFQGFNEPGRLGPLIALCLPQVAAAIVLTVLSVVLLGGAIMSGAALSDGSGAAALAAFGVGGLILVVIAFAVGLAVFMLQVFAVPKVMFEGGDAFAAMKQSFAAAMANIGAILVFVVVLSVGVLVPAALLSWLPFIGMLIVLSAFYAFFGVALYVIYRDVYGVPAASIAATFVPAPPSPPAPPAPPAPSAESPNQG